MPVLVAPPDTTAAARDFTRFSAYLGNIGVIYHEGEGATHGKQSLALRPVKQDTGNNPEEIRPEYGDYFAQSDFSHGQDQGHFHGRDPKKFYRSEGFDISRDDRISHLYRTQRTLDWSAGGNQSIPASIIQVDGKLMASWGGKNSQPGHVHKHSGAFPGQWATEDSSVGEAGGEKPGPTRFYPNQNAGPQTPAWDSEWEQTNGLETRTLAKTKQGAVTKPGVQPVELTSVQQQSGITRLVTEVLKTGQTFSTSDKFSGVLRVDGNVTSSFNQHNCKLYLIVKVMASDNTTVRATLYESPTTGEDAIWGGEHTRIHALGNLSASYTTVAGDYLVVEVGISYMRQSGQTDALKEVEVGGTTVDLPLTSGSTEAGTGWVEFSNAVTFASEATTSPSIYELTTDGANVYAAMAGNGIHKRDSAGTWVHHNDALAKHVAWVKDRLMAATDRSIYEITAAGAAPTPAETLQEDWTFTAIWENGSFIYASAINEETSQVRVHHYGLNSAGTAMEKKGSTPIPNGELIYAGGGYLSQTFLGVGRKTEASSSDPLATDPVLYRGFPDDAGFLTYDKITEDDERETINRPITAIATVADGVLCAWQTANFTGIGKYHMGRAAFSQHLQITSTPGQLRITDIFVYQGRVIIAAPNFGVYYEDIGTYVTDAELISSFADFQNAGLKRWESIEVSTEALPAGTSVDIHYSTQHPSEDAWTLVGSVTSAEGKSFRLTDVESRGFAVKITSHASADGSVAPEIRGFSVRSLPSSVLQEWVLERTIRILNQDRKDARAPEVFQDPNAVKDSLETLLRKPTTFYEQDTTYNVQIEQISMRLIPFPVYDTTQGEAEKNGWLATLVMIGSKT